MRRADVGARLDRALGQVRFTPEMERAVRRRMEGPPRRSGFKRAIVAVAVCAALLTAALAAGPAIWEAIQAHLGWRAAYASRPQVAVTDQGFELGVAAALADRNVIRVYLTLRDLEGDRLRQGAELDLSANAQGAELDGEIIPGITGEMAVYDPESGTLLFSRTFYRQTQTETLRLSTREIGPGHRDFFVDFNMERLAEAVPDGLLESAVGEDGKRYLLPEQNRMEMDWERCPLPEGEEPGIWISSMGYAEDDRLHVRFQWREDVTLLQLQRPPFDLYEMERMAVFPDGVDYAFPAGCPAREDLLNNQIFFFNGDYSTQGGAVSGSWALQVPLEPVDSLELAWPGGTVTGADGLETDIEGVSISTLSVCVACTGWGGTTRLETMEKPVVTLRDGTQAQVRDGVRVAQTWKNGLAISKERLVWELEEPVELDQVESVTLCGETMTVEG